MNNNCFTELSNPLKPKPFGHSVINFLKRQTQSGSWYHPFNHYYILPYRTKPYPSNQEAETGWSQVQDQLGLHETLLPKRPNFLMAGEVALAISRSCWWVEWKVGAKGKSQGSQQTQEQLPFLRVGDSSGERWWSCYAGHCGQPHQPKTSSEAWAKGQRNSAVPWQHLGSRGNWISMNSRATWST